MIDWLMVSISLGSLIADAVIDYFRNRIEYWRMKAKRRLAIIKFLLKLGFGIPLIIMVIR